MGRANKKVKTVLITAVSLGIMVAIIPVAIWVTHTQSAELGNDSLRCQQDMHSHASHQVVLQNEKAAPQHTAGHACDTLTITNLDPKERLVAFGPHEHHASYDGVSERILGQGQSMTITLIQPGTFYFHDHTDDIVQGSFTVYGEAPK